MPIVRRKWTPREADEWTREDWFAIILSPLSYIGLAVGVALSLLFVPVGFIILAISAFIIFIMHWIIDPKLKTLSEAYEKQQKKYLENLEMIERWEEIS